MVPGLGINAALAGLSTGIAIASGVPVGQAIAGGVGQLAGGLLGAALGAPFGPVGVVVGGMIGGYIGQWVGYSLVGLVSTGRPPAQGPNQLMASWAPPFTGGQGVGVQYRIQAEYTAIVCSVGTIRELSFSDDVFGPVQGVYIQPICYQSDGCFKGMQYRAICAGRTIAGSPQQIDDYGLAGSQTEPCSGVIGAWDSATISGIQITRLDGQPDVDGDLEPPPNWEIPPLYPDQRSPRSQGHPAGRPPAPADPEAKPYPSLGAPSAGFEPELPPSGNPLGLPSFEPELLPAVAGIRPAPRRQMNPEVGAKTEPGTKVQTRTGTNGPASKGTTTGTQTTPPPSPIITRERQPSGLRPRSRIPPSPGRARCPCNGPVLAGQQQLAAGQQQIMNSLNGGLLGGGFAAVLALLGQILELLQSVAGVVGVGAYPVSAPAYLTQAESGRKTQINNHAEMGLWQTQQLDAVTGQFPSRVTNAQGQAVDIPNVAEGMTEIMGLLMSIAMNSSTNLNATLRNLTETAAAKQRALSAEAYARANAEFLGYEGREFQRNVPASFTPGADLFSGLLNESNQAQKVWGKTDTTDLRSSLTELLHAAAIIRAVYWRRLDSRVDYQTQIRDLIKQQSGAIDSIDSNSLGATEDDWNEFLNQVEMGFGLINPYGRAIEERPRIRDLNQGGETANGP